MAELFIAVIALLPILGVGLMVALIYYLIKQGRK